jgi:tetratricopeptide (TPR) repeat protein
MKALLLAVLAAAPASTLGPAQNPVLTKAKEREELIQKLRRDIFKVDRSIGETDKLIAKSRNAPYLPDLQFRLAELYVEKSRYIYYLQAETRQEGKGAMVSPETRLLKQKAIQIYHRILREFPDFKDGDKVQFYLAHEMRELGQFDDMLKTLDELIRKHPASPVALDSQQIIGDYHFDKADLAEAEKHYQAVLEAPPSPVHDLARYKLGWIRINQGKHADAVVYFEAAAASAPLPGADEQKALNVKREALLDLVYSYTEARPAKGAIQYFEKLSDSRTSFALALDKLGNRYFIKTQYEFAIPALRRLMEIQPDPELDLERAEKIYDSLKASKGKVAPKPVDIHFLVRAAIEAKIDPDRDLKTRKRQLADLEEMARDLATQIHVTAQKREEPAQYLEAADAYKEYLSLFRPEAYVRTMMRNRADAVFAAKDYVESARQFEELAKYEDGKNPKGHESAMYGALLSHFSSLKQGEVNRLTAFEVADARQALKLLGATYVSRYPRSEHAVEVKFNIARAFYEDGEYERSSELFTAFALANPDYKDAPSAGNLALDSLRQRNDFKGIEETGKKFLASRLPASFQAEVRRILTESRSEALGELALKSSEETGDVVEGLLKVAQENKGKDIGEKALYGAFSAAREKRDLQKERELGAKIVADYPKSQYGSDVLLSLARHCAEAAHFDEAAGWFEQVGLKLGSDNAGIESWLSAARLRSALRQYKEAIRDLETATDFAGARKAEVMVALADARLKNNELAKARGAAEQALRLDRQNSGAAAVVAEVQATLNPGEKPDGLIRLLTTVTQGPKGQSEEAAKGLWYLGEILFRNYKQLPAGEVEQKVAAVQQLEGIYTQAAQMGSPEWAVASLWKLALAYQHLADVVEATPAPAGLSPADAQQFRTALKEQVAPLKERADGAFKACLSRAVSLEVFTPAVLACRDHSEAAKSPVSMPAPAGGGSGLEELRRKAEAAMDVPTLEALGMAYLQARQLPMAQLTLGRASELQDNRPSTHNALGLSLLLQGDAMAARSAYGKALDSDPTFDKARANLAALRCRFGDQDGARRELALLKEVSSLSGPDLDPEWKACR